MLSGMWYLNFLDHTDRLTKLDQGAAVKNDKGTIMKNTLCVEASIDKG